MHREHQSSVILQWISLFLLLAVSMAGHAQRKTGGSGLTADRFSKILEGVQARPADSKTVEEAIEVGFALLREGRYTEGLSLFIAVGDANRRDNRAMYGGALALFNLGRTEEAERLARVAIQLSEANGDASRQVRYGTADALVLLGVILAVKGDAAGALAAVSRAVTIAPANFDAQFALGRALYGAGDPQKASAAFRRAIALRPMDVASRFFLATALETTGDYDQARTAYSALISIHPNNPEGHLGLGVLLVKLGGDRMEEGIGELEKVIALSDNLYEARLTLGRALIKTGRPSEAVRHLARAAELAPNNPEPHYQLAIAYRRLGKRAEAEMESDKVKAINAARRSSAASSEPKIEPNKPK